MPLILGTNSIKDTGYDVANSLRFDDGSSDHLTRTPSSSGTTTKSTISVWLKRSNLGGNHAVISTGSNDFVYKFNTSDELVIYDFNGSSFDFIFRTTMVFRDVSSWYNIILSLDSTQSTSSNRAKLFVNGSQITAFEQETYPSQNFNFQLNGTLQHLIGREGGSTNYFDGYMSEFIVVDGTALNTTDVGEFDQDTPTIWKPKDVSGLTFGTNGFYLDFENASSLGADVSGNSNNFTVNNLTSVDQSTDTCTNNFATFNGVLGYNSTIVLAEGNLKGTTGSTHQALYGSIFSSIGVTQGAWYAEFKVTTNSNHSIVGISADLESDANGSSGGAYNFIYLGQGIGYYGSNGKIFHTSSDFQMTYGSAVSNNDIVGVALDVDNQEVYFSINGVFQNSGNPESGASKTGGVVNEGARNIFSTGTGTLFFAVADFDATATCAIEANFGGGSVSAISSGNSDANGHGNFSYAVPSGYFSLCTKNLAEFG